MHIKGKLPTLRAIEREDLPEAVDEVVVDVVPLQVAEEVLAGVAQLLARRAAARHHVPRAALPDAEARDGIGGCRRRTGPSGHAARILRRPRPHKTPCFAGT